MRCSIKILVILLSIGSFPLLGYEKGFGYSVPTHQGITRASVAKANIEGYLKTNLTVSLTETPFRNIDSGQEKSAAAWIIDGSVFEDNGIRWLNHFHNPITNQGLTDPISNTVTGNQSAATWAISDSRNEWSWAKARAYFYQALTAQTQMERSDSFSKTFRALGQAVHLIQDASVPEHVRNDQHVISAIPLVGSFAYEPWVQQHIEPLLFSPEPFSFPVNLPLRSFWDTDQYIDSPTQQGPFTGLAEFTSYNFFSEDTIFTENNPPSHKHYFPHPRKEFTDAVITEETAEDGQIDKVRYVKGYLTEHLAAYSYMDIYIAPLIVAEGWRYNLDSNVYNEYASILIPQAVGYSAGLLDYFFRGEMEMVKDHSTAGQYVIQNKSGETMSGTFSLFYDDASENRHLVVSWSNLSINPHSQSTPVTFTAPTSPQPIEMSKYILVFSGTLGNEEGAVVGSLVSLESNEPRLYVHFTLWDTAFTLPNTEVYWDIENDVEVNLSDIESVSFARNIRDIEDLKERTYTTSRYSILPCGLGGPEGEVVWSGPNPGKIFLLGVAAPFGTLDVIYKQQCSGDVRTTIFSVTPSDRLFGYSFVRGNALGYLAVNIHDFQSYSTTWDLRTNGITTTNVFREDSKFGIYLFTEGVLDSRIEGEFSTGESLYENCPPCSISFSGTGLLFEGGGVTLNTFDVTRSWAVTVYGEHNIDNRSQTQRCGNLAKSVPDVVHVRIDSFNYDGTQLEHVGNKHLTNLGSFLVSQLDKCPSLEGLVAGTVVQ